MFLRYFAHVYQIPQSYELQLLKYRLRQRDVFVILGHFLPFYCINNPKNWTFEKNEKKNTRRYHHFTLGHHKLWSYYVWFLRYGAWQTKFFLMFWSFFALLPQENQNFEMMKEVSGDIIISHMCTKNYDQIMFNTWDMVHDKQTDRWTDWLMEKVTQKGGCPT